MFGKNNVMHPYNVDGHELRLVSGSPFLTIQGEGPYAGHPAIFIRLHGCNLRCTFCDTKFDDPADQNHSISKIIEACQHIRRQRNVMFVVITGGEPLIQNILPLCQVLRQQGFNVQIETAGTVWIDKLNIYAKIVCSPKTSSINRSAWTYADAFKYVISVNTVMPDTYIPRMATQPGGIARFLAPPRPGADVYLSPMDEADYEMNKMNREMVAHLAMKHNVFAGLQMHKFMGVD